MLYDAAQAVPREAVIVEIGSHHGRSTAILASATDARVVAVDPYHDPRWGGAERSLDLFRANLDRLGHEVTLIRDYGASAGRAWAGADVGMLFVDGAHDYENVSADLAAWRPHLSSDATVFMHDAFLTVGVTRAMFEHMYFDRPFAFTGHCRSLVRFEQRPGHLPGQLRMVGRLPWFVRNLAIKYARKRRWPGAERLLGSEPGTPLA